MASTLIRVISGLENRLAAQQHELHSILHYDTDFKQTSVKRGLNEIDLSFIEVSVSSKIEFQSHSNPSSMSLTCLPAECETAVSHLAMR